MTEQQPRILIVDDREQNRYVLCRVLRQASYECLEVPAVRVSRNLVLKHKGTIRFRSSTRPEHSGTNFEVFLPVGGLTPGNPQHDD